MNAVERLLARADEVMGLFDALFGPVSSVHNRLEAACLSEAIRPFAFHDGHAAAWRDVFREQYVKVLTDKRLALIERWECEGAVYLAVERTIAEHDAKRIHHGRGHDLTPQAVAAYCDVLAQREDLLDAERWTALTADVVQESAAWNEAARDVMRLARRVRAAVQSLWQLDPKPAARRKTRHRKHRWQKPRATLLSAIEELRPLAKPPKASSPTSTKQTGSKPTNRRDRKHGGGRPPKYPMKFIREVFAARERAEKHAAKAKQRLPTWAPWLWDFCQSRINIAEMFPSAFKGEPWEARAERFRKAAKKRLRPAGN